jgi:hypothetical protein
MSAFTLVSKDWRELSEAASKERDPNKLMELIAQLNEVLQEREERVRGKRKEEPPKYS